MHRGLTDHFAMRLDSHQHFWTYSPDEYPWMTEKLALLKRDFLPEDLAPLLAATRLDGSIAVQARQTLEETHWLLQLARSNSLIKGVVGWVDLRAANVREQLASFASDPKFVGVRHVVQDEPDDDFMLGPAFQNGIAQLREFDLAYDILIYPRQLPAAIQLVRCFPEQRFVLDHLAKPQIRDHLFEPWATDIRELASSPNVFCKVSGMVTEASWSSWNPSHFQPYLDLVFEHFGDKRLMFGSDWPVCLLAAHYFQVVDLIENYVRLLGDKARANIFGGNAARFYQVKP